MAKKTSDTLGVKDRLTVLTAEVEELRSLLLKYTRSVDEMEKSEVSAEEIAGLRAEVADLRSQFSTVGAALRERVSAVEAVPEVANYLKRRGSMLKLRS